MIKEKQGLEEKLKGAKTYINKLEQRILQASKPTHFANKGQEASSSHADTETNFDQENIEELKQIILNQKCEIQLLTQSLQESEFQRNQGKLSEKVIFNGSR